MPPTDPTSTQSNSPSKLAAAITKSRLTTALKRLHTESRTRLQTYSSRAATLVQNSWLYQWLTTEPDPDIIVIDLRDTYTVGPLITLLDRIVETLTPHYQESTLRRGIDVLTRLTATAANTRIGRITTKLLERPQPPTHNDNTPPEDNDPK